MQLKISDLASSFYINELNSFSGIPCKTVFRGQAEESQPDLRENMRSGYKKQ